MSFVKTIYQDSKAYFQVELWQNNSLVDTDKLDYILNIHNFLLLYVGHEVLWVIRDCISESILLARSIFSSSAAELELLIK